MTNRPWSLMMTLVLAVSLGGCTTAGAGDVTTLATALHDDAIILSQGAVPAGPVAFDVTNEGSVVHEIEVFIGDSTDLPVKSGVADTSGMTLIDEVEDIPPGLRITMTLDLAPGVYVVVCNLPGHYEMGMVTLLTVTG